MRCGGRRTHYIVHDPAQIDIDVVPVGKGIHESGTLAKSGPDVVSEWGIGLGIP